MLRYILRPNLRTAATIVCAALLVAACPQSSVARAADDKADELVNRAVELRRKGDDEGARALLLKAYAMGHSPRATGQLALCEQALGRWADAEVYVIEALNAEADPWVKKNRAVLEDALVVVRSHIARVEIQGEPDGAEVWVNGVVVGKLPLAAPVRVSAGEVEVELRIPGFVRESKTMRLEAGQYQRLVLRASKQPAPAPPPPSPPATGSPQTTTVVVNIPEDHRGATTPPAPEISTGRASLKWFAWGLGAAGVGVGAYGAIQHSSLVSAFDKADAVDKSGCGLDAAGHAVDYGTGMVTTSCTKKKSAYEDMARLALGGFVAGGALVVAGLVLWLTEPRGSARETALACAPSVGERVGVGCALRF